LTKDAVDYIIIKVKINILLPKISIIKGGSFLYTNKMQLFNDLKVGDMVWAKIPLADEELNDKIRPYLVVSKNEQCIYAYATSITKRKDLNNYQTYGFYLTNSVYAKISWLQLDKIEKIPIDNLLRKISHLNDYDLSMIEKRLLIMVARGKSSWQLNVPFEVDRGDVVQLIKSDNTLYYVHAIDNGKIISYPISHHYREHWLRIKINRTNFYINFSCQVVIKDISKAIIINIASNEEVAQIDEKKKEWKHRNKHNVSTKKTYPLGTILGAKKGDIMYLYELAGKHFGVNLKTYKITPVIMQINNINSYKISGVYPPDKIKKVVLYLYDYLEQPNFRFLDIYMSMM
jgi:mRNA-degrading endonuclease toxin of MazEF toxin-antitoxin module